MANNGFDVKWAAPQVADWLNSEYPISNLAPKFEGLSGSDMMGFKLEDLIAITNEALGRALYNKLHPTAHNQGNQNRNEAQTRGLMDMVTFTNTLLAPFPLSHHMDLQYLTDLLCTNLTIDMFDQAVRETLAEDARLLAFQAYAKPLPVPLSSEMLWSSFYDTFCNDFVVALRQSLVVRRNIVDLSITYMEKKRDFLLGTSNGIVLVCGEDKAEPYDFKIAVQELSDKHKGSHIAIYGDLDCIIGIASAGVYVQFFRMTLQAHSQPIAISALLDISTIEGRKSAVKAYINIIRWARTVERIVCNIMPVNREFLYDSPWKCSTQTSIYISANRVVKRFELPQSEYDDFIATYSGLKKIGAQKEIMGINKVELKQISGGSWDDRWHNQAFSIPARFIKLPSLLVQIESSTVGARFVPICAKESRELAIDVLNFLVLFHAQGLVYRDLRSPNILRNAQKRWFVIDFECAGKNRDKLRYSMKAAPPECNTRQWAYETQNDLWELGQLLNPFDNTDLGLFVESLKNGEYKSAKEALEKLSKL